ncbi:MAG: V-type ATP synthase subunit F [Candidatus Aenigmarchaeota archaeon]|nr:V-type ATP synthase subunit F [Candidatus Aenigmarchaeota archaeon]
MDIGVVGDEHFVAGFRLAGIRKTFIPAGGKSVTDAFRRAAEDRDIGLLIMHSRDFASLDEKSRERAMTQVQPTVILLSHDISAEESLRMMIVRALGIDVWGSA